ncbi:MAG: ADP-ribosylglycohydrolase family protein [archaeon]
MNQNKKHDRILGCLVGVAAGDAMGMPTSMMSPETIRKFFPEYVTDFYPAPKGHILHQGLVAGQVTDDTQQTLLIADSIIANGCVDPEDVARRLIQWGEDNHAFDSMLVGPSTLRALYAIRAGKSIKQSGSAGDTNGAPMRIASVGIFGAGNLEKTVNAVEQACLPTHNTNIAIAGSSAIAMAIGCGISGEKDIDLIIKKAMLAAEKGMQRGNIWYSASIVKRTQIALDIVQNHSSREAQMRDLYDMVGGGVQISETVPLCLAVFKMARGNPVEAIGITTNLGGDCDTTSAITGSICGAYSGIGAFPKAWMKKLADVNHIDFEYYADKLFHILENGKL